MPAEANENPAVFIVDDDEDSRKSLYRLFHSAGFSAQTFESATAFLDAPPPSDFGCLILDLRMPNMSGLELQQKLQEAGVMIPVIFYTGYADVPVVVRAMQAGAFEVIEKPYNGDLLIEKVRKAAEHGRQIAEQRKLCLAAKARLEALSQRELEVAKCLADGMTAAQIGAELGISSRTAEAHRRRIMEKLDEKSTAGLVRLITVAALYY